MTTPTRFSLLYPAGTDREREMPMHVSPSASAFLRLDTLFRSMRRTQRFRVSQPTPKDPLVFATRDPDVIRYRLDIVEDLLHHDSLYELLDGLLPDLEDLRELFMADNQQLDDTVAMLYTISQIELYTNLIEKLHAYFERHHPNLASEGMNALKQYVIGTYTSEEFRILKEEYGKMTESIRSIRSVTIGVNLDAQLNPIEAGLVSINVEPYQSGNIIDKLLRLDFSNNPFHCLAPLEVAGKGLSTEQTASFRAAVNGTLASILKQNLKSWRPAIRQYNRSKLTFLLGLIDEIQFMLGAVSLLRTLREMDVPICKPEIDATGTGRVSIKGLYNPVLLLERAGGRDEDGGPLSGTAQNRIVLNDLQFDENGKIFILTGPNQGGKSVYLRSAGIAQVMFQLGLFVPARSAVMSVSDRVFVHTPDEGDGGSGGRFADECHRLSKMFESLTSESLILMDETFSSTSAAEGSYIAEQILKGMRVYGCRVIFATHLHDLARKIDELNADTEISGHLYSRIDSLVAEIDPAQSESGVRSYRIVRSRPQGDSFARHIAQKYGLTLEQLMFSMERRMKETV